MAESSGKPLEVEVASTFQSIWSQEPSLSPNISLGPYFVEPASDKYRELDVLIEWTGRAEYLNKPIDQSLLVLCSCKGFPSGMAPITYSLAIDGGPDYAVPTFACSRQSVLSEEPDFGTRLACQFLSGHSVGPLRRIVGFDTFAEELPSGKGKPGIVRKGDRDLFLEGWDSAVKASVFGLLMKDETCLS